MPLNLSGLNHQASTRIDKQVHISVGLTSAAQQVGSQPTRCIPLRRSRHHGSGALKAQTNSAQHSGSDLASSTAWQKLSEVSWEGSEADALALDSPLASEHPLWRLMLLSDGSVTRHLQLLTGSSVTVDCLSMAPVSASDSELPASVSALKHPLLQREVLLRNSADGDRPLVHATSWWNVDQATANLQDPSKPIWVSLSQARKELYREIKVVRLGSSPQLEEYFGTDGPFWGRQYLFWSCGEPLTLIHEVFSPHLKSYLR